MARIQSAVGQEDLSSLADLSADLGLEGVRTLRRMSLSLGQRTRVETSDYLVMLGYRGLSAEGQSVYEFQTSAGRLWIPAQLLALATVGSQKPLRLELLSPEGPCSLMTAVVGPDGLEMRPTLFRNRSLDLQPRWHAPRLEWIQCYPSVRRAWSSVYVNALEGRMEISAIAATCEVNVRGIRADDGAFLVTSLKITQATPDEEPFEFAQGLAASTFLFDSKKLIPRPPGRRARAPRSEAGLEGVPWTGAMNDGQWAAVEPLLAAFLKLDRKDFGRPKRKYELRQLIDAMLEKNIRGVPWAKAHPDAKCATTATELFYRLAKDGVWAQMVAALGGARDRS
jgi:hypothetical protein